jgi:hypothetical protein
MKRVNLVSPAGDIISVTQDQVNYLISVGYRLQADKPVKGKVKIATEVMTNGNI